MNDKHEDRVLDLIDDLLDHPEEDFLSGKMMREWAEKCIAHETDERDAVVAFLATAGVSPAIVAMIDRGTHRKRSSIAMREIREAAE